MQPVIGKIERLTNTPPSGGSSVPNNPNEVFVPFVFDLAKLDEAQQKADKLKATLLEIQCLVQNINVPNDIFTSIEKSVETLLKNHLERRQTDIQKRIEQNALRVKRW